MRLSKIPVLLILFLASAPPLDAEKLYRYRDAAGNWAFADRPPEGRVPVQVEQVRKEGLPNKIGVRNRGTEEEPDLYLINEYFGPVEIEVVLAVGDNIASQPSLPARFIIPAAGEKQGPRIRPIDRRNGWSYKLGFKFMVGDPRAVHRPAQPYRPPVPPGQSFPITQAFNGAFSHFEPHSIHAVDIAMPEGTPVHAARSGTVMASANDFDGSGLDREKFGDRANFICIVHDDGTMAFYAHMQLEASRVTPGSRVSVGQLIGYSGNTGYSGGPHLHFVIQRNAGMSLVSVPFEFDDGMGRGVVPVRGMVLKGF